MSPATQASAARADGPADLAGAAQAQHVDGRLAQFVVGEAVEVEGPDLLDRHRQRSRTCVRTIESGKTNPRPDLVVLIPNGRKNVIFLDLSKWLSDDTAAACPTSGPRVNPLPPGKKGAMPERVRFHFDPICPWCYQTSRWARRLEELGVIEIDWGFFSLELQNAGNEPEELAAAHVKSGLALQTAVLVRDTAGGSAVGKFYKAIGERVHERGEPLEEPATIEAALTDIGLDAALCAKATENDDAREQVSLEHRDLCERTRSFGVPTIVLDGGDGPAIFGPVISEVPSDEEAIELWRHVSWLVRYENFAELKRDRFAAPDLESARRREAARAARRAG